MALVFLVFGVGFSNADCLNVSKNITSYVVSDITNKCSSSYREGGASDLNCVEINWCGDSSIKGAYWIWSNDISSVVTISKNFKIVGRVVSASLSLLSQYSLTISLNQDSIELLAKKTIKNGYSNSETFEQVRYTADITSSVNTGINYLQFSVDPQSSLTPGLLYIISVKSAVIGY